MGYQPITLEAQRNFPLRPGVLWDLLANTDNLDREIGMPTVAYGPVVVSADGFYRQATALQTAHTCGSSSTCFPEPSAPSPSRCPTRHSGCGPCGSTRRARSSRIHTARQRSPSPTVTMAGTRCGRNFPPGA